MQVINQKENITKEKKIKKVKQKMSLFSIVIFSYNAEFTPNLLFLAPCG